MEKFSAPATSPATPANAEKTECIKAAQGLYAEMMMSDDVDFYGSEALAAKHKLDEMTSKFNELRASLTNAELIDSKLPRRHPDEEKVQTERRQLPRVPDYPLSYEPKPSSDHARVDGEQPVQRGIN